MYGLVVGIYRGGDLNSLQDIRALPVSGGTGPQCMVMTYIYHQTFLDTRNKNMYGFGVGISTVFKY
jgi:hypothetical protein